MSTDDEELEPPGEETESRDLGSRHPKRWLALREDVILASCNHELDPNEPLHKIGRFDTVALRGGGGYGLVFEAIDPELHRRVALKLCCVRDNQTADDILAEARLLAKLTHPNVITVYETGRYGEDVFFVMEYATGKTAHHFAEEAQQARLQQCEGPGWQEIVDIYLAAGAGLAAAHAAGIVHGDFKPLNVLLDEGGVRPRVADFGLARIRLEHTPEHERDEVRVQAGTLAFAALEVLRGHDPDARSDQWSFCAALWQSLEGVLPFNASSTDRMLTRIEEREPRWINPMVPELVRDVLRRGLSKDPSERYASMDELLRELELVRQTAETPAPVSTAKELMLIVRPPKRRVAKGRGWGSFVLGGLIAGSLVSAASYWRSPSRPMEPGVGMGLLVFEPRSTNVTACAITRAEEQHVLPAVVEAVCKLIRQEDLDTVLRIWQDEYQTRLDEIPSDEHEPQKARMLTIALATDSLIVARTFVSQAEILLLEGRLEHVDKFAARALSWTTWPASILGKEDAGVRMVRLRAKLVQTRTQSQHSTTPLPSIQP